MDQQTQSKLQLLKKQMQDSIKEQTVQIEVSKEETQKQNALAQAELQEAIPAIERAKEAVDCVHKSSIQEMKALSSPPPVVQTVMSAVMVLLEKDPSWATAKKEMADPNKFTNQLKTYDVSKGDVNKYKKVEKYTKLESFNHNDVKKISFAASHLCSWVVNTANCYMIYQKVKPLRERVDQLQEDLTKKETMLKLVTDEFEELMAELNAQEGKLQQANMTDQQRQESLQQLQVLFERGDNLVQGRHEQLKVKEQKKQMQVAQNSVSKIEKKHIAELKSLNAPPEGVKICFNVVCKLFGKKEDWKTAKAIMAETTFMNSLLLYDADNLSMKLVRYIQKNYTQHPENAQHFQPELLARKSLAAGAVAAWINSLILYRTTLEEMRGGQEPASQPQEPSNPTDVQIKNPKDKAKKQVSNDEKKQANNVEKKQAEQDLEAPISHLSQAEAAINSIKPADITELKGMRNTVDITRLTFDAVHIIFQRPLDRGTQVKNHYILKQEIPFVADSFDNHTKHTLTSNSFLKDLCKLDKDCINDETIELLQPYRDLMAPNGEKVFNHDVAKKASAALAGLCVWANGISDYHKASHPKNNQFPKPLQPDASKSPSKSSPQRKQRGSSIKPKPSPVRPSTAIRNKPAGIPKTEPTEKANWAANFAEKEQAGNVNYEDLVSQLSDAESAFNKIKPADITELKNMRQAVDTTRLIMDALQILFQRPMNRGNQVKNLYILKQEIPFVADSYENHTVKTLVDPYILKDLFQFSETERNYISEETIELLQPYIDLMTPKGDEVFNEDCARKSSMALSGLCGWIIKMSEYHKTLNPEYNKYPQKSKPVQKESPLKDSPFGKQRSRPSQVKSKPLRPSTVNQSRLSMANQNQPSFFEEQVNLRRSLSPAKRPNVQPQITSKLSQTIPRKRTKTYGNVAQLTPQQELFAQRMDEMRREGMRKQKAQYAKTKRINEMYLAEDETRQQVAYQRLYEQGTKKQQGRQFDGDGDLTPQNASAKKSDRMSYGKDQLSYAQISHQYNSPQQSRLGNQ